MVVQSVKKRLQGLSQKETFGKVEEIEKSLGLVRNDHQKKAFQGPQCVKILNNLDMIRSNLPQDLHSYVDALSSLKIIYQMATAKEVDPVHRIIIENFKVE